MVPKFQVSERNPMRKRTWKNTNWLTWLVLFHSKITPIQLKTDWSTKQEQLKTDSRTESVSVQFWLGLGRSGMKHHQSSQSIGVFLRSFSRWVSFAYLKFWYHSMRRDASFRMTYRCDLSDKKMLTILGFEHLAGHSGFCSLLVRHNIKIIFFD